MKTSVNLYKVKHHPNNTEALQKYELLVGLEKQKKQLLSHLRLILDRTTLSNWEDKYHKEGLKVLSNSLKFSPLILLSGDVGCGKTELASVIGSKLSKELGNRMVHTFETPSDLRGNGRVGELSARITAAFNQLSELKDSELGILIIDEADDLASSRDGEQQHHEDRAGVNALIKELDRLEKNGINVAVIFITNRSKAMDPAILRRAAVEIRFMRPGAEELREIFSQITDGINCNQNDLEDLVNLCLQKDIQFTFSDLYRRVIKQALINAWSDDVSFSISELKKSIKETTPTPNFKI